MGCLRGRGGGEGGVIMKRFLILVTAAIVATSLVTGCAGGVKPSTESEQAINTGINQEFIIELGSNSSTGYSWQESYDEIMLELVENTYKPGEETKQGVVGAGGIDYFRFKALKTVETKITMVYKRPWEKERLEQIVFTVDIE